MKSIQIPDCRYLKAPSVVTPAAPTPTHTLYLSNLDDQLFLRFPIRYLFLFRNPLPVDALIASLSRTLVEYYPFAGRLRSGAGHDGQKLELDCNAEGAIFAEACVDLTVDQFLAAAWSPNRSWEKLIYRIEGQSFVDVPPLVVQATHLSCGGMILCTVISHCLADAIGVSQFLHTWALLTTEPTAQLPVRAVHERSLLKPRAPPRIEFSHPEYTRPPPQEINLAELIRSQPLVPVSIIFSSSRILNLKKQIAPSIKCTSFDAVASHVWCSWIKALSPPPSLRIKLIFTMSVRRKLEPELPSGYYGNGFVLACAETSVAELASGSHHAIKMMQEAKDSVRDGYLRSTIDLLEERRVKPDMSSTLLISSLTKLGLEELDFGGGKPLHMTPMSSEIYCMFVPVIGDLQGFTMLMSVPQGIEEGFRHHCLKDLDEED